MTERYLVTGASGFIGTHLIRRLCAAGAQVVAVDLKPPRERLPSVDYRQGDVRDLSEFHIDGQVNRIYNLAAIHTTPGHQNHEYYETNVLGALQVTRLADRLAIPEIVFTSSISVYGPSEDMKTEDSVPAPASAYGYSKLLSEQIHRGWLDRQPERKLTIVRPAVVFGPGEGGNFTRLAKLLKKGFFIYPGRKDTIKACIYVEDLLDALAFAQSQPEPFVLFNGAYPDRYTLEQIVTVLIQHHFPRARSYLLPRAFVSTAATGLGAVGFLNIGIHPDRVTKLVRSTDIYPTWLMSHQFQFPSSLETVMQRWQKDTQGAFT